MRRALDTAKASLDSLTDRDAIVDCFFDHGRRLFQFSALFMARSDAIVGRRAYGVGAPSELVARLSFPINEPGVFLRARELRRPFISAPGDVTEADAMLFGHLGRAMPNGLVVPLIVRDRVVAIFLGDAPADGLQSRAREAGRSAVELTKEEMLLWSGWVGEALERVIRRRRTGSIPPPAAGSSAPIIAPLPAAPLLPLLAPPPPADASEPIRMEIAPFEAPSIRYEPEPVIAEKPPSRVSPALLAVAAIFLVLAIGGVALIALRPEADSERIAVPGSKIAGWPSAVDPGALLDVARNLSDANNRELASIRAELVKDGRVDTSTPVKNTDGIFLSYVFVGTDAEVHVRVDKAGVHAPRLQPRAKCGGGPCRVSIPLPTCSFAQIREEAKAIGAKDDERVFVTYSDGRSSDGTGGGSPEWTVAVVARGRARIDAATCKALPGERLVPPPLPPSAVPGAPRDVDISALLPIARVQSGLGDTAVLLEVDAHGVGDKGHVDLSSGENSIVFTFSDPPNVQGRARRWREVTVNREGIPPTSMDNDQLPIPSRLTGIAEPPTCSFATAYKTAGDLPKGTPARIVYTGASGTRGGEFKVEVSSIALLKRITDGECVAWERLGQERPGGDAPPNPKKK